VFFISLLLSYHFSANSYGQIGEAVITSSLHRLFVPETVSKAIAPLRYLAFAAYVLVPFVAVRLIKEDLNCSTVQAIRIMTSSSDVGQHIHPLGEDIHEIEAIFRQNAMLARKERAQVSFLIYLGLSSFTCT
jgi:RTC4-like domain